MYGLMKLYDNINKSNSELNEKEITYIGSLDSSPTRQPLTSLYQGEYIFKNQYDQPSHSQTP